MADSFYKHMPTATSVQSPAEQKLSELLTKVHREMDALDVMKLFAQPVTDDIAPQYSIIITNPMDLSTMQGKIEHQEYKDFDSYCSDFNQMCDNCTKYNGEKTEFGKIAKTMKKKGNTVIRKSKTVFKKWLEKQGAKKGAVGGGGAAAAAVAPSTAESGGSNKKRKRSAAKGGGESQPKKKAALHASVASDGGGGGGGNPVAASNNVFQPTSAAAGSAAGQYHVPIANTLFVQHPGHAFNGGGSTITIDARARGASSSAGMPSKGRPYNQQQLERRGKGKAAEATAADREQIAQILAAAAEAKKKLAEKQPNATIFCIAPRYAHGTERKLSVLHGPDRADIHLDASVGSLYKTDMSLPHDLQTMLHQKVAGTGASRGAGAASVVQRFQQSGQLKYSKEYGDDTVEAYCKSLELFCDGVDASALNDGSAKAGDGAHGDSVVAKICASRILNATLRDLTNNPETAPGEGEAVVEEEGVAEDAKNNKEKDRGPQHNLDLNAAYIMELNARLKRRVYLGTQGYAQKPSDEDMELAKALIHNIKLLYKLKPNAAVEAAAAEKKEAEAKKKDREGVAAKKGADDVEGGGGTAEQSKDGNMDAGAGGAGGGDAAEAAGAAGSAGAAKRMYVTQQLQMQAAAPRLVAGGGHPFIGTPGGGVFSSAAATAPTPATATATAGVPPPASMDVDTAAPAAAGKAGDGSQIKTE